MHAQACVVYAEAAYCAQEIHLEERREETHAHSSTVLTKRSAG